MEGAGEEVEGGGRRESEGSGRGEGQWGAHLHFRLPFSVDGGCGREEQVGLGRAVGAAPWTLRAASRSPADPERLPATRVRAASCSEDGWALAARRLLLRSEPSGWPGAQC